MNLRVLALLLIQLALAVANPGSTHADGKPLTATSSAKTSSHELTAFGDLPGWAEDDHSAALLAFRQACAGHSGAAQGNAHAGLQRACGAALSLPLAEVSNPAKARAFFEAQFLPYRLRHDQPDGLLTGYFEPELTGALKPDKHHQVPVFRRPGDLVDVVPATERAKANAEGRLASMRKTAEGLEPYYTRAEIEAGALAGRGLELLYLESPVDAYFMHVQGSGLIRLSDGSLVRIGYAGKNGYPYTSAGSVLIRRGAIRREDLTLQSMRSWFAAHPAEMQSILNENKSYIFFERRTEADNQSGPLGALGTPLTPRRSVAVDPAVYALGTPIFVSSDSLRDEHGKVFRHLMVAQDVGSAIHGPERADIFWGTGSAAEAIAGRTKDRGHLFALLPRPAAQ